jgi:hypothetical protein
MDQEHKGNSSNTDECSICIHPERCAVSLSANPPTHVQIQILLCSWTMGHDIHLEFHVVLHSTQSLPL